MQTASHILVTSTFHWAEKFWEGQSTSMSSRTPESLLSYKSGLLGIQACNVAALTNIVWRLKRNEITRETSIATCQVIKGKCYWLGGILWIINQTTKGCSEFQICPVFNLLCRKLYARTFVFASDQLWPPTASPLETFITIDKAVPWVTVFVAF